MVSAVVMDRITARTAAPMVRMDVRRAVDATAEARVVAARRRSSCTSSNAAISSSAAVVQSSASMNAKLVREPDAIRVR